MLWFNERNGEAFVLERVTARDITDYKNFMRSGKGRRLRGGQVKESIRNCWEMEFNKTRFPETMFNACMMLAHGHADGMSPSALAHLLHSYLMHLKKIRKR